MNWPLVAKNYKNGLINLNFVNGDVQYVNLVGQMMRPVITLNTSGYEGLKSKIKLNNSDKVIRHKILELSMLETQSKYPFL